MISKSRNNSPIRSLFVLLLLAAAALPLHSCGRSSSSAGDPTKIALSTYDHPTDVTASPDGKKLYVVNNVHNSVMVLSITNPQTPVPIAEISTSCAPRHLTINAAGTLMYLDHDNWQTGCKLSPLGPGPADSFDAQTGAWQGYNGDKISLIDTATNMVTKEIDLSNPDRRLSNGRELVWDEPANFVYVAYSSSSSGGVGVIDSATNGFSTKVVSTPSSVSVVGIAKTPDNSTVFSPITKESGITSDSKLFVINAATKIQYPGSPWSSTTVFAFPSYMTISGDGKYAFVSNGTAMSVNNASAFTVSVIDITNPATGWADSRFLGFLNFGSTVKPTVMALSSNGDYLLAIAPGKLYAIPWATIQLGASSAVSANIFTIGSNPSDLAVVGNYAYVTDQVASTLYSINYTDASQASSHASFDATVFAGDFPRP